MDKIRLFLVIFLFWAMIPTQAFAIEKITAGQLNSIKNNNVPSDLILRINEKSETVPSSEISQWFQVSPTLYFEKDRKAEIENIDFCPIGYYWCDILLTTRERLMLSSKSQLSIDNGQIKAYLEDLARRVNTDPVEAKFNVEDGKVSVFEIAENGLALNVDESQKLIETNITQNGLPSEKKEIALVYETPEPRIKSTDINSMGINTLIGEGKSNFAGSPKNRIHNITVGAQRFNGVLIKPDEEFSFIKTLGPVDESTGYLPELVIKQDRTEPDFGGGMCQVSTTAFRAAINSGLKITARTPHAYPVSYYNPQGMDATVFIPRPDLKFINNTPGYILIQTKIEGTNLTFQFYGTDDGRSVKIEGPKILERKPDGSMKATFTQVVKNKNNDTIIDDVFNSNYSSPSKYPHPGEEILKTKPDNWSKSEWKDYKKSHGM
jgi:vancomycin resistance protein YoaR